MKNIYIILLILISATLAYAQSIVIESGSEVNVVTPADLCVQNGTITGNITGTGTLCGAPTFVKYDSVSPNQNKLNISLTSVIIAYFNQNMNGPTMNSNNITFYGSLTGKKQGTITYNSGNYSMQLVPNYPFKFGELISTTLDTGIKSSFGNPISPFVWSFTTIVNPSNKVFNQTDSVVVGNNPYAIESADFDGDGDIDLAVVNYSFPIITILKNDGKGKFIVNSTITVGANPLAITTSDFDGDGDMDLAVSNYSSNTVSILNNNGSGTFTVSSTIALTSASNPVGIESADIDGDGDIDVVVANIFSNSISILKNDGSGSFNQDSPLITNNGPRRMTVADFDKDGDMDIAVSNYFENTFSVCTNNGIGSFVISSTSNVGDYPSGITSSDIDSDGDMDIAVANSNSNSISIFRNNGSGVFILSSTPTIENIPEGEITNADFDGDGDMDIVCSNSGSNTVSILINDGTGVYTLNSFSVGNSPRGVTSADFDGDSDMDLATNNYSSGSVSIITNLSPPSLISPANNSTGITCPVNFSWNKSLGAGNFKFQLATDSLFNNIIINDSTLLGTDTVKSVTELNPAPMYFWRIYSKSANGFSLWSETWRFDGTALPVELISFNAAVEKNNVKLNWKTVNEINNRGFEIERKIISANEWEKIAFITGKGNSTSLTHYIFEDKKLNTGKYSYRLKQIDFNGNFEYFLLNQDVNVTPPEKFSLSQNYPNPFNPSTKIDFEIPSDNKVTLIIYDVTGREVLKLINNEFKRADYYSVIFNGGNLSSAVYFYRILAGDFTSVKKMVLIK